MDASDAGRASRPAHPPSLSCRVPHRGEQGPVQLLPQRASSGVAVPVLLRGFGETLFPAGDRQPRPAHVAGLDERQGHAPADVHLLGARTRRVPLVVRVHADASRLCAVYGVSYGAGAGASPCGRKPHAQADGEGAQGVSRFPRFSAVRRPAQVQDRRRVPRLRTRGFLPPDVRRVHAFKGSGLRSGVRRRRFARTAGFQILHPPVWKGLGDVFAQDLG